MAEITMEQLSLFADGHIDVEQEDILVVENGRYSFSMTDHRIKITQDIKKQTNVTRALWIEIRNLGFSFLGVVRDYSAVFEVPFAYLTIHHFLKEVPSAELMGKESDVKWNEVLDRQMSLGKVMEYIELNGFQCKVYEQAWIDAFRNNMLHTYAGSEWDWHLESPKHKFMVWCTRDDHSFLLEFFIDMPIPPYGLSDPMEWPSLAMKAEKLDLFELAHIPIDKTQKSLKSSPKKQSGEAFEIMDHVDADKLDYTYAAIHEIMTNNKRVIVTYSGGKDSHTCLLMVVYYLLENPECSTEVTIISASTGVENPLIEEHILKVKASIESLPVKIPFIVVRPDIEDTYWSCVLGNGYMVPSSLNRWCVQRLKLDPADRVLKEYMNSVEFFSFFGQDEVCLILGTRDAESRTRAGSIRKHFGDDFYGTHRIEGIRTAAPIRYWDARDVVTYLIRNAAPWEGYGNYNLINLYGSAMGGMEECPIGAMISIESDAISSCTGSAARMGCYSCTVIKDDSSLENMAIDYPDELRGILEMRKVLKRFQDIRYGSVTGYQRKNGFGKIGSGLGDLTLDARTLMLEHMKRLEVPLENEELYTIYRFVKEREIDEGIPVTKRFRDALFAMKQIDFTGCDEEIFSLVAHYDVVGPMYSSIWDPWNSGVDRIGQEDIEAIKRIKARRASGR